MHKREASSQERFLALLQNMTEEEWRAIEWNEDGDLRSACEELWRRPGPDYPKNRELAAYHLFKMWPDLSVGRLAMIFAGWECGAGLCAEIHPEFHHYDNADVVRLWLKHQSLRRSRDLVHEYDEPEYVIHGVLPKQAVGVLYGPPNVGKSFLALDLAHAVSSGECWFGRRTERCDVLYAYGEGHSGIKSRLKALYDYSSKSGRDIAVLNGVPNLYSD